MNRSMLRTAVAVVLLCSAGCRQGASEHGHEHGRGHDCQEAPAEASKGPHGGRMLREGKFALEVTIFERGVPPEYRVYAYDGDGPLDPTDVDLTITLRRFGGRIDTIRFSKRDDYLLGDATVEEPHSFDVEVAAEYRGRPARWAYESYEGRTDMSPAATASSEIAVETVGPASIRSTVHAAGRIAPNGERLARVTPRYAGLVKAVRVSLGDTVSSGQVLAVVENSDSLQPYDVKAPIAGTVVAKDVIAGEVAQEGDIMFTVADLSTVWAELRLPSEDAQRVRVGQSVTIGDARDERTAEGRIVYIAPIGAAETQTLLARAEVANSSGQWAPGLYVTVDVLIAEDAVAAAVKTSALQTFRDWDVVFLSEGTVFQAMPVELGLRDAEWAEVTAGVAPGQRYVTENSFIVKADIGKSGASHDH